MNFYSRSYYKLYGNLLIRLLMLCVYMQIIHVDAVS